MPVTIKSAAMKFKAANGSYIGIDAIADATTAQQVAAVSAEGVAQKSAIQTEGAAQQAAVVAKGAETLESIPSEYTELSNDVNSLKSALGEPYTTLEPVEIAITNSKKFQNTAAGSAMRYQDNTTYHYTELTVTAGEKYNVTTYFTSANTYYVYLCDANDIIVSRDKNATDVTGVQTFDVTIPDGVAKLFVQVYSSATSAVNRLRVSKYILHSFREVDDAIRADLIQLDSVKLETAHRDLKPLALSFALGFMNPNTGAVNTPNTSYAFSRGIQICYPVTIDITGTDYQFAVNQYASYNYSSSVFVRNWRNYSGTTSVTIYADTYPVYIKIGARKPDESDLTTADLANIENAIVFKALYEYPTFASIAMFNKFALTGCSWDAGSAYQTSDGHVSHTGIGWGEVLGRRNGCQVGNFAIGGSNIRSWFNNATHASAFKALLEAEAYPLYILTEGNSNDSNAFEMNDGDYSPATPSTTKYYVGSIEDISTREDYHDYPCTFYGYYGRVIEMIQAHAPKTRIIISSPDTTIITTDIRKALRTACKNIAEYYGLPYMDIEKDPYYDTYVNAIVDGHPTAPIYSGWALAIERLFSECVKDNLEYFRLYSGVPITAVTVPWEPVELQ